MCAVIPRFRSKTSMSCLAGRHKLSMLKFVRDYGPRTHDYCDVEGLLIAVLQSTVCWVKVPCCYTDCSQCTHSVQSAGRVSSQLSG